jgi:hypothetical protein
MTILSFGGTGVWKSGFMFAKQMLYCLRNTVCPFYFGDRILFARAGLGLLSSK